MRLLGTILAIIGIGLMVLGGITLFIPSDVFDFGAFSIAINENLVIPLTPVVGLIMLVIGVVMMSSAPALPPPPYPPYPPSGPY